MVYSPNRPIPLSRNDAWTAGLLLLFIAAACWWASSQIDSRIVMDNRLTFNAFDVWFEGDCPRTFINITTRYGGKDRTIIHPLFSLVIFPFVKILTAARLQPLAAVRALMSAVAGLWGAGIYALLRLIRLRRLEAVLFTLTAASSAAAMFWFTVPETWAFGSLAILAALLLAAVSDYRPVSAVWFFAAQTAGWAITLSNVGVSWAATFFALPLRKAAGITAAALLAVAVLFGVERAAFRTTQAHLPFYLHEYILPAGAQGPLVIMQSFFGDTLIMPDARFIARNSDPGVKLITQNAPLPENDAAGVAATWLWLALLVAGTVGIRKNDGEDRTLRLTVIVSLLGQLAMHIIYGDETFLYSLHFLPLLIALAAYASRSLPRPVVPAFAAALLACTLTSNVDAFRHTTLHLRNVIDYNAEAEHAVWAQRDWRLKNGKLIRTGIDLDD